jgi:hypothetical protein
MVCHQAPGIGETGSVIADLSEHPSTGRVGQPGETGDDRVVGMPAEQLGGGFAKLVRIGARCVESGQQRQRLSTHCGLDQKWLAQLEIAQSGFDLSGGPVDVAATASTA